MKHVLPGQRIDFFFLWYQLKPNYQVVLLVTLLLCVCKPRFKTLQQHLLMFYDLKINNNPILFLAFEPIFFRTNTANDKQKFEEQTEMAEQHWWQGGRRRSYV